MVTITTKAIMAEEAAIREGANNSSSSSIMAEASINNNQEMVVSGHLPTNSSIMVGEDTINSRITPLRAAADTKASSTSTIKDNIHHRAGAAARAVATRAAKEAASSIMEEDKEVLLVGIKGVAVDVVAAAVVVDKVLDNLHKKCRTPSFQKVRST